MTTKISIDKAGRMVLPKALREEMHGSSPATCWFWRVQVNSSPCARNACPRSSKRSGASGSIKVRRAHASIPDLIDLERANRLRETRSR